MLNEKLIFYLTNTHIWGTDAQTKDSRVRAGETLVERPILNAKYKAPHLSLH